MEELRKNLATLRYENERLRGEVNRLRETMERKERVRSPPARMEMEEDSGAFDGVVCGGDGAEVTPSTSSVAPPEK